MTTPRNPITGLPTTFPPLAPPEPAPRPWIGWLILALLISASGGVVAAIWEMLT